MVFKPPCKGPRNGLCWLRQLRLVQVQVRQWLQWLRDISSSRRSRKAMVIHCNDTDSILRAFLSQLLYPLSPWEKHFLQYNLLASAQTFFIFKKKLQFPGKYINNIKTENPSELELAESCDLKEPQLDSVACNAPCFFWVHLHYHNGCLVRVGAGAKSSRQPSLWSPASQPVSQQDPGLKTRSCAGDFSPMQSHLRWSQMIQLFFWLHFSKSFP